jgi:hypothetical protein
MDIVSIKNLIFAVQNATLAQLVRVPDCGSGGHGFESRRWYKIEHNAIWCCAFYVYLRKNFQ